MTSPFCSQTRVMLPAIPESIEVRNENIEKYSPLLPPGFRLLEYRTSVTPSILIQTLGIIFKIQNPIELEFLDLDGIIYLIDFSPPISITDFLFEIRCHQ